MNIFIDTCILLRFYHYIEDKLESLRQLFVTHERDKTNIFITEQVVNEYLRNRGNKIKDALKEFDKIKSSAKLPVFMLNYEEYKSINSTLSALSELKKTIKDKVLSDYENFKLDADILINNIFKQSKIHMINKDIYTKALKRMRLGNPPGKKNSIGDRINWELLLSKIENKKDIHIISADGDYYSAISSNMPNSFIQREWRYKKNAELYVYRDLRNFIKINEIEELYKFCEHEIEEEKSKIYLINRLLNSSCFAETHYTIHMLDKLDTFTENELNVIIRAYKENDQVYWIKNDDDVSAFYSKVTKMRATYERADNTSDDASY